MVRSEGDVNIGANRKPAQSWVCTPDIGPPVGMKILAEICKFETFTSMLSSFDFEDSVPSQLALVRVASL